MPQREKGAGENEREGRRKIRLKGLLEDAAEEELLPQTRYGAESYPDHNGGEEAELWAEEGEDRGLGGCDEGLG